MQQEIAKKLNALSEQEVIMLNAARKEFEQHGFHRANVDTIASEIGIGKATIYRHFGNKPHLFLSVIANMLQQAVKEFESLNEKTVFEDSIHCYIEKLIEINSLSKCFMRDIGSTESMIAMQREMIIDDNFKYYIAYILHLRNKAVSFLKDIIANGKKDGRIPHEINETITAEIVFITVNNTIRVAQSFGQFSSLGDIQNPFTHDIDYAELKKFVYRAIGLRAKDIEKGTNA